MLDIDKFSHYFKIYKWQDKHSLYGYPADTYPAFPWIHSLETRFNWLKLNHRKIKTSSIYLLREMIQWGGSQNGVMQKFDDRLGEVNLHELLSETINHLDTPREAIRSALKFPGMGLTYASKLLRFLEPEEYGAIDSRVRNALTSIPKIYDGNENSMVNGYVEFFECMKTLRGQLVAANIQRPQCELQIGTSVGWRAADIEMAIFKWADEQPKAR